MSQQTKTPVVVKPKNPQNVKDAIALGKKLSKEPEMTKAAVAMQMFALINDEDREIVAKAFVEGANLTEKGAMTYFYNCRRKFKV